MAGSLALEGYGRMTTRGEHDRDAEGVSAGAGAKPGGVQASTPQLESALSEHLLTEEPQTAIMLLGLLLSHAIGPAGLPVAASLVGAFGSLTAVMAARPSQLVAAPGMSVIAARLIEVSTAVSRLTASEAIRGRELIGSWAQLEGYLRVTMRGRAVETAHGLFLDRKNHLIRDVVLGEGTVDHVPLYPREIVRHAIALDASALILVHNHPSGDPAPSPADIEMTRRIAQALVSVDIALHDHVIVGDNRIASMRVLRFL